MRPAIESLLSLIVALSATASAALDYLVVDSAKPGSTLIVIASGEGAGQDALRQLQHRPLDRGRLVLARSGSEIGDAAKAAGWESVPDLTALEARFEDSQVLVFREDGESHSFDKRFNGDTVRGGGDAIPAILEALRAAAPKSIRKEWHVLPPTGPERRMVVTTNSRVEMDAELRPALRERQFRAATTTLLLHLKMVDEAGDKTRIFPSTGDGRIRVAVYDGPGALNGIGRGPAWLRARLARDPGLLPELVGVPEILNGALDHADVLVIGGGKATPQSEGLGKEGRGMVVKFVKDGGGFVGICAGAYLASNSSGKWNHLELLPVETKGTDLGCKTPLVWSAGPAGAGRVENADLNGGPIFKVMEPGSDKITIWAKFQRNETSKEKGEYALEGTPAVISGLHGKGKVALTSTHCERPPSPSNIFPDMVRWTASGGGE